MSIFPSWPTKNQGNIVGSRLSNEIFKRFGGDMTVLSFPDQKDAALVELLGTTTDLFNVKSFGLTGDPNVDDAAAFIAMLATVPAGSTLYFPAGTYLVQSQIDITKSVHLVGAGIGGTIIQNNSNSGTIHTLNIGSTSATILEEVSISNIEFRKRTGFESGDCLNIQNTKVVTIRDIKIRDYSTTAGTAAVRLSRTANNGVFFCWFERFVIQGAISGIVLESNSSDEHISHNIFTNGVITSCSDNAIKINEFANNNHFHNVDIESNTGTESIRITGRNRNNGFHNMHVEAATVRAVLIDDVSTRQPEGTFFEGGKYSDTTTSLASSFEIDGGRNTVLQNIGFQNNTGAAAITLASGAEETLIIGCAVHDPSTEDLVADNGKGSMLINPSDDGALFFGREMSVKAPTTDFVAEFRGTSTGGAYVAVVEDGVQSWYIGVDDGDDTLKFREDGISGTVVFSLDPNGNMGASRSLALANAAADFLAEFRGSGTGGAYITLVESGVQAYYFGIDDGDDDLKIRETGISGRIQQHMIKGSGTVFPAATTAGMSVNMPHGTAPSSPNDGDIWTTTAGLFVRVNGSTVGPLS